MYVWAQKQQDVFKLVGRGGTQFCFDQVLHVSMFSSTDMTVNTTITQLSQPCLFELSQGRVERLLEVFQNYVF
jgi:hypothetical protein